MKYLLVISTLLLSLSTMAQVRPCETGPGNNCIAYTLECSYQAFVMKEGDEELEINLEGEVSLFPDKTLMKDTKGLNSGEPYKLIFSTYFLDDGLYLSYDLVKKYDGTPESYTAKPITSVNGLFGVGQKSIQLQTMYSGTLASITCKLK